MLEEPIPIGGSSGLSEKVEKSPTLTYMHVFLFGKDLAPFLFSK
jgi:hypothetical protein